MVIFPSILKFVCVVSNLVFLLLTLLYQTRQELFAHLGLPKFEIFENFLPRQRLFAAAFPPFAAKSSHPSAVCPKNSPVSPEKPFFLLNFAPGACYT